MNRQTKGDEEVNQEQVVAALKHIDALITGSHIVYTSGRHGTDYINPDVLYEHEEETMKICRALASKFTNEKIEVVVGPAEGGNKISEAVAVEFYFLTGRMIQSVRTEKTKRGFRVEGCYDTASAENPFKGKITLVVEDILNTGYSTRKVIQLVRRGGGKVIAVGAIWNRGGVSRVDLDVPRLSTLVHQRLNSWSEEQCPLCAQGVPINTAVGHGKAFLVRHQK